MKMTAAILATILSACSSMPEVHVPGIDNLITTEHVMSQREVINTCAERMGMSAFMAFFFTTPIACATIKLQQWTCDIFYALDTASITLEHERLHCKGFSHDDGLLRVRDEWRSNLERDL